MVDIKIENLVVTAWASMYNCQCVSKSSYAENATNFGCATSFGSANANAFGNLAFLTLSAQLL